MSQGELRLESDKTAWNPYMVLKTGTERGTYEEPCFLLTSCLSLTDSVVFSIGDSQ